MTDASHSSAPEWPVIEKALDFTLTRGEPTKMFQFYPQTRGRWRICAIDVDMLDIHSNEAADTVRFLSSLMVRVFHRDRIHMERPIVSIAKKAVGGPRDPISPLLEFEPRASPLMELRASATSIPPDCVKTPSSRYVRLVSTVTASSSRVASGSQIIDDE